jgi:hypothetical protein
MRDAIKKGRKPTRLHRVVAKKDIDKTCFWMPKINNTEKEKDARI